MMSKEALAAQLFSSRFLTRTRPPIHARSSGQFGTSKATHSPRARTPIDAETCAKIADAFHAQQEGNHLSYEWVAGIPFSGNALAHAFCERAPSPIAPVVLSLHSDRAVHRIGRPHRPRGYKGGQRILLLDDVLSQGEMARAAIHALEDMGAHVIGLSVVVDHSQGGRDWLQKAGYPVHALFTIQELHGMWNTLGLVSEDLKRSQLNSA